MLLIFQLYYTACMHML